MAQAEPRRGFTQVGMTQKLMAMGASLTLLLGLAGCSSSQRAALPLPAPSHLVYPTPNATYYVGVAIPANLPSVQGGPVASFAAAPSLPQGLTLQPGTGALTGTPSTPSLTAPYLVTASNAAGSTTFTLQLTVLSAPLITEQPTDQSVALGAQAHFKVTATDPGPLTYQWFRNDLAIPGATAAEYLVSAASAQDHGSSFQVLVSNAGSSTRSAKAQLTVQLAPKFTTQPAAAAVTLGAGARFIAQAAGVGPFTYQWRRNGTGISGATEASYVLASTTLAEHGAIFSVLATDSRGLSILSSEASLSVFAAPAFSLQPANQSVKLGSSATFLAAATGSGVLRYQWQKNGSAILGATGASYTIPATLAEDHGARFRVVATDALGGSTPSSSATLAMYFPPTFATQPGPAAVTVGASVTFTALAAGNGPFTYQWRRNGTAITGATGASLTLAGALADHGAAFSVAATDVQAMTTLSSAATLSVFSAPSFTLQPADQGANLGSTATFTAAATASGPGTLSYQWQKNDTAILGATGASYTTPATLAEDQGARFRVVATDALGGSTPSSSATLAVYFPPTFATQPGPATMTVGASVTFTALAAGNGPFTYQWRRNGTAITGATDASLTLASALADHGAAFSVAATDVHAMTTLSSAATLSVFSAPSFTLQPTDQGANLGSTATFTAAATASGSATLSYQWQKNDTAILGATGASYTTPATLAEDQGARFRVVATDALGGTTPSSSATLAVYLPPTFATQPGSAAVTTGASVTFTALAAGNGPFTYQWRRNGTAITGATGASLTLASTLADHGAVFSVATTDIHAMTTLSSEATLSVFSAPSITLQPAARSVNLGSTATFTAAATASGSGVLSYQWQKNGTAIAGATSASYTTPATLAGDHGASFLVVASDAYGGVATSDSAALTVYLPPTFSLQPADAAVTVGAGTTFTALATGNGPITYQWRRNGTVIGGATGATYSLSSPTLGEHGAVFSVLATDVHTLTTLSGDAILSVYAAPTIQVPPLNQTVVNGGSASFSVLASGTGSLSYQWRRSGTNIAGATASSYAIPTVDNSQHGVLYTVVVTDSYGGTVTSAAGSLSVISSGLATRLWASGVGHNANPGSRTAPVLTFAAALPLAAPGAVIAALDPGEFGPLTITRAVTLDGSACLSTLATSAGAELVINAGPADTVILRNLNINGQGQAARGLLFQGGGTLVLENCRLYGFTDSGIEVAHNGSGRLVLKQVHLSGGQAGVRVASAAGPLTVTVEDSLILGATQGIQAAAGSLQVTRTLITMSTEFGVLSQGATINVEQCTLANSGVAALKALAGTIRVAGNDLFDNGTAFAVSGGTLLSAGDNRLAGNGSGGATPSATITLQ